MSFCQALLGGLHGLKQRCHQNDNESFFSKKISPMK